MVLLSIHKLCAPCSCRREGADMSLLVQRLLGMLEQAQIMTGIITNGHADVQRAKLAAICAAALFPIILVGHEEIAAGR